MKVLRTIGSDDVALIHLAQMDDDPRHLVEFVDATDGGIPREEKWVVNLSTQFGCPVRCRMCDAGTHYFGNLDAGQMLAQAERVLSSRPSLHPSRTRKLKVHFSRMGEPALNPAVPEALAMLCERYPWENLVAAVATMAPRGCGPFLSRLRSIKDGSYRGGRFQLQFSLNSTDEVARDALMPYPKLTLPELSREGEAFHREGDRKVVLNVAAAEGVPLDPDVLADIFDPAHFIVKLTPMNPTSKAGAQGLSTLVSASSPKGVDSVASRLERLGFGVVVSIGSPLEDAIGSNCGEAVLDWRRDLPGGGR